MQAIVSNRYQEWMGVKGYDISNHPYYYIGGIPSTGYWTGNWPFIFCLFCGSELKYGQKKCLNCGAPNHNPPHCPYCGTNLPNGEAVCTCCGYRKPLVTWMGR